MIRILFVIIFSLMLSFEVYSFGLSDLTKKLEEATKAISDATDNKNPAFP